MIAANHVGLSEAFLGVSSDPLRMRFGIWMYQGYRRSICIVLKKWIITVSPNHELSATRTLGSHINTHHHLHPPVGNYLRYDQAKRRKMIPIIF